MTDLVDHHITWPVERFYWGLIDGSRLIGTKGKLQERLGYLFENDLPGISIEEVHAVYQRAPNDSGSYLACGLQKNVIQTEVTPTAITLSPQEIPTFIIDAAGQPLDPSSLNLLTGAFVPIPVRRLKRRWLLQLAAIIAICAVMAVIGIERRMAAVQRQFDLVTAQQNELFEQVMGSSSGGGGAGSQPPALRILAELRQLEQTRSANAPDGSLENCSATLSELLALWPDQLHVQTESVSITPASVTLRGHVPSMTDAQLLANALTPMKGWQLAQPQSEVHRDKVDVTVRLDRPEPKGTS